MSVVMVASSEVLVHPLTADAGNGIEETAGDLGIVAEQNSVVGLRGVRPHTFPGLFAVVEQEKGQFGWEASPLVAQMKADTPLADVDQRQVPPEGSEELQ